MTDGWIKLHRKILDNPVVNKDNDHLAVWLWLLLHATHRERAAMFGGKKITLAAGQLITGRKQIAEATHISESKVFRILELFKSEQQIEQQTNRHGSLISIVRWNDYQQSEQQNEQVMNNYRTTDEQQMNTKQECKNERMKEPSSLIQAWKDGEVLFEYYGDTTKLEALRERVRRANQNMEVKR